MKNKILLALATVTTLSIFTHASVSAAANGGNNSDAISSSTTAIELPGGDFLVGSGTFEGKDGTGHKFVIDPKTTSYKVTTVKEAQQNQRKQALKSGIQVFASLPNGDPSPSPTSKPVTQSIITLKANQSFSGTMQGGSGWRYARYWFSPADNTGGPYLRWESHGDSGLVNNPWSVAATSTVVNNGQAVYVAGPYITNLTSFQSYNPAKYSYYYVGNW
ncbi:hypothetical protein EFT43_02705 [Leuconostoc falkenbergense]|uniref:hypothetical protein n=1 Tax=Leuconostoc falkenbergense TaxID=2766470 RepID=UPI0021A97832|nr:hypothetical protein [Leuconostoc falkenbergense]MCT4403852.1 hypothetical protein [Leuconostoc falkenbergense]